MKAYLIDLALFPTSTLNLAGYNMNKMFIFYLLVGLVCLSTAQAEVPLDYYPTTALSEKLYDGKSLQPNEVLALMRELVFRYASEGLDSVEVDEELAALRALIKIDTIEADSSKLDPVPRELSKALEEHSDHKNIMNYLIYQLDRLTKPQVTDTDVQAAKEPTELLNLLFGPRNVEPETMLAIMKKLEPVLDNFPKTKEKLRVLIDLSETKPMNCVNPHQFDYAWEKNVRTVNYIKYYLNKRFMTCWQELASKLMDVGQVEMTDQEVRDALIKLRHLSSIVPSKIATSRMLDLIIFIHKDQGLRNCPLAKRMISTQPDKYKAGSNIHRYIQKLSDLYSIGCNNDSEGFRIESRFTVDLSSAQTLKLLEEVVSLEEVHGDAWKLGPTRLISLSKLEQPSCVNLRDLTDAMVEKRSTLGSYLDEHLPRIFNHCYSKLSQKLLQSGQQEDEPGIIEELDDLAASAEFLDISTKGTLTELSKLVKQTQIRSSCRQNLVDFSAIRRKLALPEDCLVSHHLNGRIDWSANACSADLSLKLLHAVINSQTRSGLSLGLPIASVNLDQDDKLIIRDVLNLVTDIPNQKKSWRTSSRKYQDDVRAEFKRLIVDLCAAIQPDQEAILKEAESFVAANPGVPEFHRGVESKQMMFCNRVMSLQDEISSKIDSLKSNAKLNVISCLKRP